MECIKVALIQMEVQAGQVARNREHGLELVREAARNCQLIVLPEIWTTGYDLRNIASLAESYDGPTITALTMIARERGINIIAGSLPISKEGKVYNSALVIDCNGDIIADYQKIHMFSMYGEQRFFTQGEQRSIFTVNGLKGGLAICYDLRFPELFRSLTMDGAEIVFVPAEWPTVRGEHWRILNQARALENQVFICAVNCVGNYRGSRFFGHSLLIAPDSEILAEGTEQEQIIYAEINPSLVGWFRNSMQVWQDRRPELYRPF